MGEQFVPVEIPKGAGNRTTRADPIGHPHSNHSPSCLKKKKCCSRSKTPRPRDQHKPVQALPGEGSSRNKEMKREVSRGFWECFTPDKKERVAE